MEPDVLVVDDSAAIRKILQRVLRQTGMEIRTIHEAGDGQEALEILKLHKPALILTDINMPKMDGFGFIEGARKLDAHRSTPILVLTTEGDAEKKGRARQAGATGWIIKPFSPVKLIEVLRRVAP